MSVTWMLGAVLAGACLGLAALATERAAGWFHLPRRWIWAAAMAGSLLLPAVAVVLPGVLPRFRLLAPAVDGREPTRQADASLATAPVGAGSADGAVSGPRGLSRGVRAAWLAASLAALAAFGLTQRRLRRACAACPGRRVAGTRVRVAERAGPMVVGVLEPEIVLPRWALEGPLDELLLIVRHEREHVAAGDHWLLALAALAVAMMPWSAALWWQHRRLRLAVETDCDARVLAAGESARDYGRVLLRSAGREAFDCAGAPAWGGRWRQLERRIVAMTAQPPRHRFARALPLAVTSLALAAAACGAASRGTPSHDAASAAAPEATPLLEEYHGRLVRHDQLDSTELMILGPEPGQGTVGFDLRFGSQPRTRNSPPPTELPTVRRVIPGSPAEKAGLRVGDVVVSANGRDAREPYLIGDRRPGTVYILHIRRDGLERDVRLVVGPPPSRAEAERWLEMQSACVRWALAGAGSEEVNARQAECYVPD